MKLKAGDKTKKLFFLFSSGVISQDDFINLVDSRKVNLGSHLNWTFEEFSTLLSFRSDIDIVKYLLEIEKSKLNYLNRLFFKTDINKIKVKKYLEVLKFAKDGIIDINNAILNIKQPEMSGEMKAAGFGKLSFGDIGIARSVGEFEHIGTIQAYSLQMHIVIQSLEQLAAIKRCEKAHQEILSNKSKDKKYK